MNAFRSLSREQLEQIERDPSQPLEVWRAALQELANRPEAGRVMPGQKAGLFAATTAAVVCAVLVGILVVAGIIFAGVLLGPIGLILAIFGSAIVGPLLWVIALLILGVGGGVVGGAFNAARIGLKRVMHSKA